ncbi:uncharacterized protein ACMZJ9_002775 [Mantella aurantiaca]
MPKCIIKSCSVTNRTKDKETMLHCFPRHRDRIRQWLYPFNVLDHELEYLVERIATSRKGLYRICSRHFKDTDYELRTSQKFLKHSAYPTLYLDPSFEIPKTACDIITRADGDHSYFKQQRTEQAHTSCEYTSDPPDDCYDSTLSFNGSISPSNTLSHISETQTADIEISETPYVDCILDNSSSSVSLLTECTSEIPISHSRRKLKHCTMCTHGLILSRTQKIKKINRGTQFKTKTAVHHKKTQVKSKTINKSVATQCCLVDLPPLHIIKRIDSCMEEYTAPSTSKENIFHSFIADQVPEFTNVCPDKKISLQLSSIPKIEPGAAVSSCDYFTDCETSFSPQNKMSEKHTSYHHFQEEEEQFNIEHQEDEEFYGACDVKDLSFVYMPPENGQSNMAKEKKFIVFEQCLDQLLKSSHCMKNNQCNGRITGIRKFCVGSALVVYAECSAKHKFRLWSSQPFIGYMPVGNLLLSSAILCSGSNFEQLKNVFSLMEIAFISATTHCNNQKKCLFPTIEHHWSSQRSKIIEEVGPKYVSLLGDGQWDSSVFNEKYCTYTLMDAESNHILDFQVEQLQPGQSSVSLEILAHVECLDRVIADKVSVKTIAADRHIALQKPIKEKYPQIKHHFDVWHLAKSIGAKIHAASKKNRELSGWVNLAKNHLFWSFMTCNDNSILLKEKWISIIYHSTNKHEWTGHSLYHKCSHQALPNNEAMDFEWLTPGSAAHHHLISIVQDSKVQKDLDYLSGFYHTGEMEVYHNMARKYRSKKHNFLMDGMVARTQLAAMDYNHNINRSQAFVQKDKITSDSQGNLCYHLNFSKAKEDWVVSKISMPTSQEFMKDIMNDSLYLSAGVKMFEWKS